MAPSRALLWATAAVVLVSVAAAALVPVTTQEGPGQIDVPHLRVGDTGTYAFFTPDGDPLGLWGFEVLGFQPAVRADGSTVNTVALGSQVTLQATDLSIQDHIDLHSRASVRLDTAQSQADFEEVLTGFTPSAPILPGLPSAGSTIHHDQTISSGPQAVPTGYPVPWWTAQPDQVPRLAHQGPGTAATSPACTITDPATVPRGGSLDGAPALELVVEATCGETTVERSTWLTARAPVGAYVVYGAPDPQGVDIHAALVDFEPGQGQRVTWTDASSVAEPAPRAQASSQDPGPPPTGDRSALAYPLEAALEDVRSDNGLLDFQIWRQTHPDAQVVSARMTRGEHSWQELESYTWRFVFAASDGSGYQVATELYPTNGTVETSDRGPLEVPGSALDELPGSTITLAQALERWRSVASPAYLDLRPNYVHWGIQVPLTWADDCDHVPEDTGLLPARPGMDDVVVGYSSYGTCITPKVERRESYARIGLQDARIDSLVEHRLRLGAFPDGELDRVDVAAARPVPEGQVIEPPRLEIAALTTTSLLAVLWGAYFWPVLKFAMARGVVVVRGFTRIPSSELLEHPTREAIVELLSNEPGLTAGEITDQLDIGWSTLAHHARLLERADLIESRVVGRHRHFFLPGTVDPDQRQAVALLRNENTRRVYEQMTRTPGLPLATLAEHLDMTPAGALWHVRRLEEAGLATRQRDGREVLCVPEPVPDEA